MEKAFNPEAADAHWTFQELIAHHIESGRLKGDVAACTEKGVAVAEGVGSPVAGWPVTSRTTTAERMTALVGRTAAGSVVTRVPRPVTSSPLMRESKFQRTEMGTSPVKVTGFSMRP